MDKNITNLQTFFNQLRAGLQDRSLVRITLSKPRRKDAQPYKVFIKPAVIKGELMLSFTLKHATQDITKNYTPEESIERIEAFLGEHFLIAVLFTTEKDWLLKKGKGDKYTLRSAPPTFGKAADYTHDKQKNHLLKSSDFLTELGVRNKSGRIAKDMGDKFRQINKFTEIIADLVQKSALLAADQTVKVTDMGAGKGYLTFAVYDYLVNKLQTKAEVIGVEVRPDLVKLCNAAARKLDFTGLHFEEGYIGNYDLTDTDILIALHACDTATDDAIHKGIAAGAELIICAPCCHKQIRKAIGNSGIFENILQYGILKERQAEIVTDTIRALLLEAHGYKTKVFEFISSEHTGKNLMIVGIKSRRAAGAKRYLAEVEKLKRQFGIERHYLETLLQGV